MPAATGLSTGKTNSQCLHYKQFALLTSAEVISICYEVTGTEPDKPKRSAEREHFYRAVGVKMREARDKKGFTQEAIAASVGLSRTSLTNIEKGRQNILLHTFIAIASALETPLTDLLPGQQPMPDELSKQLPPSLPPEQRNFIARTLQPSATHESQETENNSERRPLASPKPNSRSTSRR